MGRKVYTEEQHEWIRENYPHHTNDELAELWPWEHKPTPRALNSYAKNHGLHKADRWAWARDHRKYSKEQLAWLRENIPGRSWRELSELYEGLWGEPLTRSMVANLKVKLGVRSGTVGGQFRAGHEPANKGRTWDEMGIPEESRERMRNGQFRKGCISGKAAEKLRPLLSEREADGIVYVKVRPRNATNPMRYWIPRAQFYWMQANGRDWPEGCMAAHIDRDPKNDDPDNVYPVPRSLWAMVNRDDRTCHWETREELEVAIKQAEIRHETWRLRKEARGA